MSHGIDADGKARDDDETGRREIMSEMGGNFDPSLRGAPGSHDGDGATTRVDRLASGEERRDRLVWAELAEARGPLGVPRTDRSFLGLPGQ
jgi:hypothetical protein